MFCFHKWLPWGNLIDTGNGGHKQQWRVCSKCNKSQFRTLKWDEQCSVKDANDSILKTKNKDETNGN